MVRHLLRDYATQNSFSNTSTFIGSYLTSIFLRRVLLFSYVGDTNYPINPQGTLLIFTTDSTPTAATPTFAVGARAGINLSGAALANIGKEFYVGIPNAGAGGRNVGEADVGRILVLRSTANPTYNSGCFLIDGYDTGTNSYAIDYRSGTTINGSTFIASGSNNVPLPTGTINVISTTGFTGSGTIAIFNPNVNTGITTVNYTSTNGTQFLGCTGGTGTLLTNQVVAQQITLPQGTLNVASTANFTPSGQLLVISSTGRSILNYTGTTATTFTGVTTATGGTGNVIGTGLNPIAQVFTTTVAAGSAGALPQATINVASVGTFTTIIAASNNTYLPQGTINVASTTGMPTSGTVYVTSANGIQTVSYTGGGGGGTTLTGCTGGTGLLTTGNQVYTGFPPTGQIFVATTTTVQMISYTGVTSTSFTGASGGVGTLATGGVVYYSPSVPIIEPADSMNWYLYEKDTLPPATGSPNTNTNLQYRGNGNATVPRIILQSPHVTGWQLRICHEAPDDAGYGGVNSSECAVVTMIPGLGGNASGDFTVTGTHLHTPLFFNSNSTNLTGGAPGIGDTTNLPTGTTFMPYRITLAGDDAGVGVVLFGRRPGDAGTPRSYFSAFGLTENEPGVLPPNTDGRLYVIASGSSTSAGNNLNDSSWYFGNNGAIASQGVGKQAAYIGGTASVPVSANVSMLAYVVGNGQQGSPIFDGSAGDTPWMGATELFDVDVILGITNSWTGAANSANYAFPFLEGRYLGTIQHIREGRANYGEYTLSTDIARTAQHMRRGMWLLWGGPQVVT